MNALLLAVCVQAAPPPDPTVLTPADGPEKMLYRALEAECAKHFEVRRQAVAAIKTPEDLRRRQEELRRKFVEALGGFPEKTPLNVRVTGKEARDGYSVEKVIYESRPEHHVTAVLYLPEGKGPFAGVLFPSGHYDNAKAAETYQRACILLAKHGIAALAFDPVGQGERVQLLTPEGKPLVGRGTNEHMHLGVAALLVGQCAATYLVWDGIRSLDYLAGRPEIDPKRLGCLGNSGGGTQTAYLMALDERVQAAVPNCYITSLERLFATIGPQDAEQNIPGQVAFGMDHADYVTMRAPRATLISTTTHDFFDIQGAWATCREAKRVYGVLDAAARVDLSEIDDKHAISKPVREQALRWFRRWLLSIDDAAVEPPFEVAKDAGVQCTATGQVVPELKGRTAFDFVADRERSLVERRGKLDREAQLSEVRRRIALDRPKVAFGVTRLAEVPGSRGTVKYLVEPRPGVFVPILTWSDSKGKTDILYVHGEGKRMALAEGGPLHPAQPRSGSVHAVDLPGWGETAPGPRKGGWERAFGAEWKEAFLGFHLARPLLGQRVGDLLAIAEGLDPDRKRSVHAIGVGAAAPVVLHAAALDPRIEEVTLEGMLVSWGAVATGRGSELALANVVHGALEAYDLPDLAALCCPRPLTIRGSVDPMGKPLTQAELEKAYAGALKAYAAGGAGGRLKLEAAGSK